MSDGSLISWCDSTWNPVTGCTEISPGCAHCYAKVFAERWRGVAGNYFEHGFDVQLRPNKLEEPLRWKRPRRIFVNSMSDLFHESIPLDYIAQVFAVMALAPTHTFQILTKRIELAEQFLTKESNWWRNKACSRLKKTWDKNEFLARYHGGPLPNVIIGPTVENQHFADVRLPILQQLHAQGWRTMLSYEPALEAVDFAPYLDGIGWIICGGESGAKRRPFNHEWARSALEQARLAGVPFYMKQDGAFRPEVYDSLPDDLKVRQFPETLQR